MHLERTLLEKRSPAKLLLLSGQPLESCCFPGRGAAEVATRTSVTQRRGQRNTWRAPWLAAQLRRRPSCKLWKERRGPRDTRVLDNAPLQGGAARVVADLCCRLQHWRASCRANAHPDSELSCEEVGASIQPPAAQLLIDMATVELKARLRYKMVGADRSRCRRARSSSSHSEGMKILRVLPLTRSGLVSAPFPLFAARLVLPRQLLQVRSSCGLSWERRKQHNGTCAFRCSSARQDALQDLPESVLPRHQNPEAPLAAFHAAFACVPPLRSPRPQDSERRQVQPPLPCRRSQAYANQLLALACEATQQRAVCSADDTRRTDIQFATRMTV
eukprot:6178882-Pleurochrysis_carterae.AAC.1